MAKKGQEVVQDVRIVEQVSIKFYYEYDKHDPYDPAKDETRL